LIEPVDYLFEGLKKAYAGHDNLLFENLAVTDQPGVRTFFRVSEKEAGLPWYAPKIGGLSDKVIRDELSHLPNLENLIVREPVRCETLDSILQRRGIEAIDILQIDAEGEDFRVLRSIDLERYRPSVVMVEHKHISMSERAQLEALLVRLGYEFRCDENDLLATRGLRRNAD
jgi:FkbM family methyltransferase